MKKLLYALAILTELLLSTPSTAQIYRVGNNCSSITVNDTTNHIKKTYYKSQLYVYKTNITLQLTIAGTNVVVAQWVSSNVANIAPTLDSGYALLNTYLATTCTSGGGGGSSKTYAANGLTKSDSTIRLGGILTSSTTIQDTGVAFSFPMKTATGVTKQIESYTGTGTSKTGFISLANPGGSMYSSLYYTDGTRRTDISVGQFEGAIISGTNLANPNSPIFAVKKVNTAILTVDYAGLTNLYNNATDIQPVMRVYSTLGADTGDKFRMYNTGDIELRKAGNIFLQTDISNHKVSINNSSGNTMLYVAQGSISGGHIVALNQYNDNALDINPDQGYYAIGDISQDFHQSSIIIDDLDSAINITSQRGSVLITAGTTFSIISGGGIGATTLSTINNSAPQTDTFPNASGIIAISVNGNRANSQGDITIPNSSVVQYETPASGFTINVGANTRSLVVNPAANIAALTIKLPASLADGAIVGISFNKNVTALTINGNGHTVNNAPVTAVAGGYVSFVYTATGTAWFKNS